MALNMKTLTQALAKASAVIEKTVSTTVQEVTGPRPLQDYELLDQAGSGGPGLAWRRGAARAPAPPGRAPRRAGARRDQGRHGHGHRAPLRLRI